VKVRVDAAQRSELGDGDRLVHGAGRLIDDREPPVLLAVGFIGTGDGGCLAEPSDVTHGYSSSSGDRQVTGR
jgi:hypothetical protein